MSDADGADWPPEPEVVTVAGHWVYIGQTDVAERVYFSPSETDALTVSTTDPAIRAAIIPTSRGLSVDSIPPRHHWMPRDEPEPAKRAPGEVTNLLDPFNVTDEALMYRRGFGNGPDCRRPMIEALDDHCCFGDENCPGAEDCAVWFADPASYEYSDLDPVFEWEAA